MALRFSAPAGGRPSPRLSEVPVLSPSEKPPPADVASKPAGVGPNGPAQHDDPTSESMGSLGTRFAKQGDVNHVCKALEATAGDVWLVDSGATCHIVSTQHLSGFRVVKKHERTANLFNASGGSIVVSGVVDLEVHFGDVFLRLEEVLVAEVGFNVISPWTAYERDWKTFLSKGGSRLYKGNKKSIKLMGAQRAWWAVSGSKKNPKRQPKGAVPMEIDSISEGPKPGRCAGTALPGPALTGPEAPPGILKNRRKEAEYEIEAPGAQNPLSGTPFSFLFRGFVSDFSVSGPSEAPVFRDEDPEVHEASLGEPYLLRKEHELEVVEHDCAHEFSEVCSDFEFSPERPKAFRKLWHGVSMFELVRKPCSLNFGMLGLFGMTLLLAAVFACLVFQDGQFVAYGRNGISAAYGRNGTSAAFGRDCTSAAFGRDCTSAACGRGCSSIRAEWWYERGAYYAGSSDLGRDWWSVLGSRTCGGRALGGWVVDLRHFTELCRSRGRTGSSIYASSSGAITWGGSVPPFACCGAGCRSSAGDYPPVACCDACCRSSAGSYPDRSGRRRHLGSLASTGCCLFGGPGCSRCQAPASRDPIWKPSSCRCGPDSERVGGGSAEASVPARAGGPSPGGRGFGPPPSGGSRRSVASFISLLRTPSPSQMHDSLALCLTDRSFLTRVALGGSGRSDDLVGGATGVSGRNRLSRPEEYGEPTPYVPPRPPRFPEEDPARRPLLIDQATITENALEEWHTWLKMAKQGRSLREWGLISADVITAVEYLGEAPPQEEPARGGHWSNAPRGGGKKKQKPPQEFPTAVGTLLYLKKALKAIDAFDGSPSGYRGLLLGPASAIGLEKPDGSSATDEKEAWKYLAAAVALRVQRLLDKKKAKNRMVDAMTAIWLQKPKAAAAKPRPVQPAPPRTPTTPAEESSDSSSEGVSEVSGESQLEGEGVAESIGILRSLGTETLWQPGVITRVFGTPALPVRLFPEVGAAASSSNPVGGIAAGTSAMAPPTPAATPAIAPPTPAVTEPKSPASLASVIHRPGMLVAKTLLASDGSTVPLPPGVPPRHVLPQPPPPPSKSPSAEPPQDPLVPSKGRTQQEREFTLPSPLGAASSAPSGAPASETGTQFADYEAVVEAAKAAMARASRDL